MTIENIGLLVYIAGILFVVLTLGALSKKGDDSASFVFFSLFWPISLLALPFYATFRLGCCLGKALRL